MKQTLSFCAVAMTLALFSSHSKAQTVIAMEDFDGGDVNLVTPFDTNLNFADISMPFRLFGTHSFNDIDFAPFSLADDSVIDLSQSGKPFPGDFEGIFGMGKDMDDTFFAACSYDCFFDANEANRTGTWEFDVSSATEDMTLCIDMGQLSDDRFDGVPAGNFVMIEYRFDGGAFQEAFTMGTTELVGSGFEYREMDNGNQATIDFFGDSKDPPATAGTHLGLAALNAGVTKTLAETGAVASNTILNKSDPLTGQLDTFSIDLVGSGDLLEVRVIVDFSFEAFAMDNIVIKTPGGDIVLGDVNCDGVADLLDVAPFVALVTGGGFSEKADINMDGIVDLLDVNPFVAILTGG